MKRIEISKAKFDAVIFDLDGVITQSAKLHANAWEEMFNEFIDSLGEKHKPFDINQDYLGYIDGKPRIAGVRDFLASRNIDLPEGSPDDLADNDSIQGLAKRKNDLFLQKLRDKGVDVYSTSVELVRKLREKGFKVAVVSSSKNCSEILKKANLQDLFEVQVDGVKSEQLKLHGKPLPDIFLQAADELKVKPERSVVVEDSLAGVEAGKRGQFGLVIGVNRGDQLAELEKRGADRVVSDLKEIEITE